MADVDAAGIIYFASALRWAERLSTGWMRELGYPHSRLFNEGIATPAVRVNADYRSHIKLDDQIRLDLSASHIGRSSFTFRCEAFILGEDSAAVETQVTHVFVRYAHPSQNAEGARSQPETMPDWLRDGLTRGYRA
jgi:YbgC/YbaW family acyl-CoA thioester hydrolase